MDFYCLTRKIRWYPSGASAPFLHSGLGLKSREQGGSHYRQLKLTAKENIQQILFCFRWLKLTARKKIQHRLLYYRWLQPTARRTPPTFRGLQPPCLLIRLGLKSREQGGSHYRQLKLTAKEKIQQIIFCYRWLQTMKLTHTLTLPLASADCKEEQLAEYILGLPSSVFLHIAYNT